MTRTRHMLAVRLSPDDWIALARLAGTIPLLDGRRRGETASEVVRRLIRTAVEPQRGESR